MCLQGNTEIGFRYDFCDYSFGRTSYIGVCFVRLADEKARRRKQFKKCKRVQWTTGWERRKIGIGYV